VEQYDPLGAYAVGVHTGPPLEQSIAAALTHSLNDVHDAPWLHATQLPDPLHTPPGHPVPAATLPTTLHTGPPLLQSIAPIVHGFPVEHGEFDAHGTHDPLPLHTPPGQPVPAPALPAN
jgi:hypothetical protein